MRKRLAALLMCLICLLGLCVGAGAAAGGADDPLLSVSYLYDTVATRLRSLFERETAEGLDVLGEAYSARLDAIRPPEESPWDRAEGYEALSFGDGGSLRLAAFGKFLLTEGSARLHIASGEVIDLSEGRVCAEGEELIPAHRYFAAEASEALIRIYSAEALGFVDGNYLAEESGDFDIGERFPDLEGHWGRSQILALAEAGLVNGMEAHRFEPDRKVTRAMFVTILGRMHGLHEDFTAPIAFSDVQEGDWFAPYVTWAALSGIVNGYDDGTFAPNREITREQMALILVRYCEAYDCRLPEEEDAPAFTDEESISPWALEAVLRSRRCGLINGRDDGSFDPAGTATRAEMCAVMARLMEKTKETGSDAIDEAEEPDAIDGADGTDETDGTSEADGTGEADEIDGTDGTDEADETDGTSEADGTGEADGIDGTDGTDEADEADEADGTDGTEGTNETNETNETDDTGEDQPLG